MVKRGPGAGRLSSGGPDGKPRNNAAFGSNPHVRADTPPPSVDFAPDQAAMPGSC